MITEIPKFHETFNPIFDILSDGEIIPSREMENGNEKYFISDTPEV